MNKFMNFIFDCSEKVFEARMETLKTIYPVADNANESSTRKEVKKADLDTGKIVVSHKTETTTSII